MFEVSVGSLFFVIFLVLGPIILRNNSPYRKYIFLAMNLLIYVGSVKYVSQLIVAALFVISPYVIMKINSKFKAVVIIMMVCFFAYFMKYDFIFVNLHVPYIFVWKILGLSYFLFRQIDFIMQYEYLKENDITISFIDYCNYIISFWTLLAGPIQRYEDFVGDFYLQKEALSKDEILKAVNRAVNGYLKVFVVSGFAGYFAKGWFDSIKHHSSIFLAIVAFVIFAFFNGWYIYFNFSGYCDIVISFAKLSGFNIKENFNRPYLSRNVVEFWNRHHITLSEWIRDYIYSPLFKSFISGPMKSNIKLGQYLALFLTFTIAGVWHGTDLNYLAYGLFQGLGIVVATSYRDKLKKKLKKSGLKKYDENKKIGYIEICATWMYICLTFSFVGYDVIGLIR